MKNFWALPALVRLAVAGKNSFSVNDDLLAHPQYEIKFPQDYISEQKAQLILGQSFTGHASQESDSLALQKQDPSSTWTPSGRKDDSTKYEHEMLIMQDQRYLCSIPVIDAETEEAENATLSKLDQEKELERANNRGWELLQEMQGRCIYYWSGWWSYRYCFNEGVKQFHQLPPQPGSNALGTPVEDPNVPGFYLGTMEGTIKTDDVADGKELSQKLTSLAAAKSVGALETRGDTRYLVQKLEGGTVCDLTNKERKIDIQFHCSPSTNDHIAFIKELATCTYLMVINTPRLCNDVAFLPPSRDHPNPISCSPVLKPDEVPAYKAKIAARAKKTIEQEVPNPLTAKDTSRAPARVGDIIVGAHKWVPEGRELEKTAIVGGGKETFVDVIANSMGKSLSTEELKKLGITSTKQIDALKKQLDKIAGDKDWSLEVVDTPRGREYRGIIGDENEEEGEGVDTKKETGSREEYEKDKYDAAQKEKAKKVKDRLKQATKDNKDGIEKKIEEALNRHRQKKTEGEKNGGKDDDVAQSQKKAIMEALEGLGGDDDVVVLWDEGDGEVPREEL
ncbi:Glucosidase II beta subunit-like protein 2 [Elsinoe fawcettii]|nr:Glucosidase II beta subunit-like protein 2 [Elsinoe fawcettii]